MHRIEIRLKPHLPDARGLGLVKDISDLGITSISTAHVFDVYYLDASLSSSQVESICRQLLADPVTQDYSADGDLALGAKGAHDTEVAYNAGVIDPVEESVLKGISDLGISGVRAVKTAKRYLIEGKATREELDSITGKLLVNPIIQHVIPSGRYVFSESPQYKFNLVHV
jgi:phosphoribosylformylglycinamidine (FGAM) synthase PurS component